MEGRGPLTNKLWNEIQDEFKKNPSDEIVKSLLDKYNLPYETKESGEK